MKHNIIKFFLLSLFLSFQTPQLSFCMEQESNVQYQTYSSLFYNTLTSKYFLAAVFLYGISPFSPFSCIKNSWRYSWNRLFSSSPSDNKFTQSKDNTTQSFDTPIQNPLNQTPVTVPKRLITKEMLIEPFEKVYCCVGIVTFDSNTSQKKLTIKCQEDILEALNIEVKNHFLTITFKKGFNVNPTIEPLLDITLGFKDISKITVAGPSTFIFNTLSKQYFELNAQDHATIQASIHDLILHGTFNFDDNSKGTIITGNMGILTITAKQQSEFTFAGAVSNYIKTDLSNQSKGTIKNDSNFKYFNIEMNESSVLEAQGTTLSQDITLNRKSEYKGTQMQSNYIVATLRDNSQARVNTKNIYLDVSTKSQLTCYGNPQISEIRTPNSVPTKSTLLENGNVVGFTLTTT